MQYSSHGGFRLRGIDMAHETKFNNLKNKTKYIGPHVSQIIKFKNSGPTTPHPLCSLSPPLLQFLSPPPIVEYTAAWPAMSGEDGGVDAAVVRRPCRQRTR